MQREAFNKLCRDYGVIDLAIDVAWKIYQLDEEAAMRYLMRYLECVRPVGLNQRFHEATKGVCV